MKKDLPRCLHLKKVPVIMSTFCVNSFLTTSPPTVDIRRRFVTPSPCPGVALAESLIICRFQVVALQLTQHGIFGDGDGEIHLALGCQGCLLVTA